MTNLVIGGTGFLGRHIVAQLVRRGEAVRVFCRRVASFPPGVEISIGDLSDKNSLLSACRGVDTVFHTAALPEISVQWEPFYRTNIVGTRNVINACVQSGVRKLIYTSSPSVIFDDLPQEGLDESVPYPTRWLAHYPHSKAIAEQEVLSRKNTILTCALRPHLIWGPGDRHLIPRLLDRARRGKLVRVGDGTNLVDMTYVENAATAHIQAADALTDLSSPVNGNAYFLSQGKPVNCWNWIDEILRRHGLPPVRRSISLKTAWRIGAAMETWYLLFRLPGEPTMTRFLANQLAQSHYFDISRARRDFGYTAIVSTEMGMDRLTKSAVK